MSKNREEYAVRFLIEAAIEEERYGFGVSSNAVEKNEISQPTAYRAQERLVDAGLLKKKKRGSHYQLTEEAKELFDRLTSETQK